jgi:hypothetical protein
MIGSISVPIPVSTIQSNPAAITTGSFFGFNHGYTKCDTIMPGKGYWIKSCCPGTLILSSDWDIDRAGRIRIVPTGELPPPPPIDGGIVKPTKDMPKEFALEQNYPNPFNPTTIFQFSLPTDSKVSLTICNILGQRIATLVDGLQSAGYKSINWNASSVASGLYFYRIEATSVTNPAKTFTQVKKMALVK